jgi:hypothetical protein
VAASAIRAGAAGRMAARVQTTWRAQHPPALVTISIRGMSKRRELRVRDLQGGQSASVPTLFISRYLG